MLIKISNPNFNPATWDFMHLDLINYRLPTDLEYLFFEANPYEPSKKLFYLLYNLKESCTEESCLYWYNLSKKHLLNYRSFSELISFLKKNNSYPLDIATKQISFKGTDLGLKINKTTLTKKSVFDNFDDYSWNTLELKNILSEISSIESSKLITHITLDKMISFLFYTDHQNTLHILYRYAKKHCLALEDLKIVMQYIIDNSKLPCCIVCQVPLKTPYDTDKKRLIRFCSLSCRNKSESYKKQYSKAIEDKYGAPNMFASTFFKNKKFEKDKNLVISNLTNNKLTLLEEYKNTKEDHLLLCNVCNSQFTDYFLNKRTIYCPNCNPRVRSSIEVKFLSFIKNLQLPFNINTRPLHSRSEIDFYFPSSKVAFEINGNFWHSCDNISVLSYTRNRHLNKLNLCNAYNVKLLQFQENEINEKFDIVSSMVSATFSRYNHKIFARKCILKEVTDKKELKDFLEENHIQGYISSGINLGLYYDNVLVQVMTFDKGRFTQKTNYELLRLCSKLNTRIIGGSEKLFKYFINNYLKEGVL